MQNTGFVSARLNAKGEPTASTGQRPVPWWSFTKTVLATAALILVDQGRLILDDPLPGHDFTLRHLLQHRSGLPDYGWIAAYQLAARNGQAPWSTEQIFDQTKASQLLFAPGQGWRYSNIGYLRVRELIEETAGQTLDSALKTLIFDALARSSVRIAATVEDLDGTEWGNPLKYDPGWFYHGLLLGTAKDAARFLHHLITGAMISAEVRTQMLSHIRSTASCQAGHGSKPAMA
jgi:CubicO group peptidase (beta-lactamase class C family)